MVLAVGDADEAEEIKKIASKPLELYGKHLQSFRDLQDLQMFVLSVLFIIGKTFLAIKKTKINLSGYILT